MATLTVENEYGMVLIEGMVPGRAYVLHHELGVWPPRMTDHRIITADEPSWRPPAYWERMVGIEPSVDGLTVPLQTIREQDSDVVLFIRWASGYLQCFYYSSIFRAEDGTVATRLARPAWIGMDHPVWCSECGGTYEEADAHGIVEIECEECSTYHCSASTVRECDECGVWTCTYDHCMGEDADNAGLRHADEDSRFDGEAHPKAAGRRFVGIEIEAEGFGASFGSLDSVIPQSCGISGDGSLQNGIEIQTPPARGSELVSLVGEVCSGLVSNGFTIADSCGLHVHLDLTDRQADRLFISRLFGAFYAIEPMLFALQVEQTDRDENGFCRPLRKEFPDTGVTTMWRKDVTDIFSDWYGMPRRLDKTDKAAYVRSFSRDKYHESRYRAVNFHSIGYRGTLEVRIHEGSLDADDILAWTDLLQSVLTTCDDRWPGYRRLKEIEADDYRGIADLFEFTEATRAYMTKRLRQNNLIEETEVL